VAELLLLLLVGMLLAAGVLVWRAGTSARFRRSLVAYELQFPHGLRPEAVTSFMTGLAGLAGSRWQREQTARGVIFEVHVTQAGIAHRLLVPQTIAGTALAALRAQLPAVRVTELPERCPDRPLVAVQLGLSSSRRMLTTTGPVTVATGILASLQPLAAAETVILQWVVMPVGPVAAPVTPKTSPPASSMLGRWLRPAPASRELLAAERTKRAQALFAVTPRVGVTAGSPAAAHRVLGRVLATFHAANAPGVHLFRRTLPSRIAARSLAGRYLSLLVPPCLLNATELAMLVAFPTGDQPAPGLRLGASRLLAPSADIPSHGKIVAEATFPGAERPLAISVTDSLRHCHVIGPTGVGKSTLMTNLIYQDMVAGRGVIVIDPKGDLASDVLDRVPASRVKDVIVLDPNDQRPVGFNLLGGAADESELLVDQVVGVLHNLFASSWGPRTDDIVRAALLTLMTEPGMTLCELPLLLTDHAFRRRLVGRLDEPIALEPFWSWYEALSDAERTQAIGPVMNKLRAFLLRRKLRTVLGQSEPKLDLGEVLREGRILIVPLAKGILGEETAALIGSLLVARLWQAVMGRAAEPAANRRPVFCYLDEFQDFLRLPTSVADVLAQARGLGMGLVLAHQHLGQLPRALKEDVLANARSRVIFQTAASDAKRLGQEVAPHLTPADLQNLGPYEVAVTLSAGGRIAPPASGRTVLPPEPTGMAADARAHSAQVYGQDRADIEAAIRTRHGNVTVTGGIGRQEVPR
jgi:hypothetical protein